MLVMHNENQTASELFGVKTVNKIKQNKLPAYQPIFPPDMLQ